ncbi:hypothetical protein [Streptomyces sp. NPDC045714]|uniref:hypothetical protein n=1 Tax=Streptomyces sp. NPDC045714 TaxID=3154913 RepID=UPI00340BF4D2
MSRAPRVGGEPGAGGGWKRATRITTFVEMGGLDPEECDHLAPDGRAVYGTGGVDAATISTLTAVPVVLPEAGWLAPDQQARLLAVVAPEFERGF